MLESGSAGESYGERLAAELVRLRDGLDDLRRRPIPPDVETLRHVVTASLTEASAPPPNLLVTAIRRLDRLDARLESIEAALGAPAALPRGGGRGRAAPVSAAPLPLPAPAADPEAIADALARRLAGMMNRMAPAVAPMAAPAPVAAATIEDLVRALRPLVPDAARNVLRRAGREPSPQAVEVLQQTALTAIEEAVRSAGQGGGFGTDPWAPDPRQVAAPPPVQALAPGPPAAPQPPPPPPPPPIDVDELASTIAAQVAATVAAQLRPPPAPPAEPMPPAPEPAPLPPPLDPKVVADAVITRLAEQPPPQAVVSPMAMAPLLSAVGNVEAAVARIAEPDVQVVGAVSRLEAGVEALARALEDDRSLQADEVRRGFTELHDLLRTGALKPGGDEVDWAAAEEEASAGAAAADLAGAGTGPPGLERLAGAAAGLQRRLDRLSDQLEPLESADLAAAVPEMTEQGQRLERSLNHILTALAALAEHLHEQSSTWRGRFDDLEALVAGRAGPAAGPGPPGDLGDLRARLDELVSGLTADRQRYQRLGGTIDGLAELLGQVSSRLDRQPRAGEAKGGAPADEAPVPPDPLPAAPPQPGLADAAPAPPWELGEAAASPPDGAPAAGAAPDDGAVVEAAPAADAAPSVPASPWDAADDEPWMRDDPWAPRPADAETEAEGDPAGGWGDVDPDDAEDATTGAESQPPGPAFGDPTDAAADEGADGVDEVNEVGVGAADGAGPPGATAPAEEPPDGAARDEVLLPDQGRRRRRNRRGNRRG